MHFRVGQLGIYREEWVGTKEEETLHIRDRSWDREKQCWKKVIPGSESFVGLTQGKQTICVKVGVGDGDDDDEVDAWCQCVSGPGESLSIQNWPYPPTTSTRYTSLPNTQVFTLQFTGNTSTIHTGLALSPHYIHQIHLSSKYTNTQVLHYNSQEIHQ